MVNLWLDGDDMWCGDGAVGGVREGSCDSDDDGNDGDDGNLA